MIEPGSIVAHRFLVERRLGAGGMGVVFQVRHRELDEVFALKVLRPDDVSGPNAVARFRREARAAAGLRGEHVVRVSDFGQLDDGSPYFVMEYVEGLSLAALLRRDGPLTVGDATRVVLHACAALAEAHPRGIIHRDLKPANLLRTSRPDGSPLIKVADFGIAKMALQAESLTETQSALGSPAYMSPEQIRDAKSVDARTDIWSLGAVLFELLSGQTPFHAFTAPGILSRVLTEPPTPLRSLRPELPEPLVAVAARCLEKDPSRRFASLPELAEALAPFAPEPGEDARIQRIWALARTSPSLHEFPPPSPPDAGQTTEAPTSLTQTTQAPPHAAVATAPSAASPTSRMRAPQALAGLALGSALLWLGVSRWPSAPPSHATVAASASAQAPVGSAPAPPPAPPPPAASPPAASPSPEAPAVVAPPTAAAPTASTAPAPSAKPAPRKPAVVTAPAKGTADFGYRQ